MQRKVAAAIIAALALAVTSCGGSEKTTLTRAQLVRQVELACREAQTAWKQRFAAIRRSDRSLAYAQRILVKRLEQLEASGEAKDDFITYKDGVRTRLEAIEKVVSAPQAERGRAMRAAQKEAEAAIRKGQAAARRLGIDGVEGC